MDQLAPIRREILVPAEPAAAFRVFTDQIGTWWPLAGHSVHGEESSVAFVDGALLETAPERPDALWGRVTEWEPPTSLAFTWHPGGGAERASHVRVTFTRMDGDQTLVRLEHSGWEKFDAPESARAEYDHGWPRVLDRYQDAVRDSSSWTWVALLARPGPAAAGVANLFRDPRFGLHLAFLERMQAAGQLVAAGPFVDEPGAGMTVLRLRGADRIDEATRLATVDDLSVAEGFLTVTVRPWNVALHA